MSHSTSSHIDRYDRQCLLSEVDQSLLSNANVLVVGAGGLGSCLLLHLAGAGVASGTGRLLVIDADTVALDNLHRQVIHRTQDTGVNKAESAWRAVKELNPDVNVEYSSAVLSISSYKTLVSQFDLIIDCTDNLPTKVLLNDISAARQVDFLTASVVRWHGQINFFPASRVNGCYRCVFGTLPSSSILKSAKTVGVMGSVVGVVSSWQATEAIKILNRRPDRELLIGKTLFMDLKTNVLRFAKMKPRNPECKSCGKDKNCIYSLNHHLWDLESVTGKPKKHF
ncbi:hypothetical protein P9112_007103 [Eukaryota sp. TZLM1-RC]